MTFKLGCCDTGGGQDRFAPTILVGNVAEGDPATNYSTSEMIYYADIGDGAGIEAAVVALVAKGTGGRIYVRRGQYDFNLAGSPIAPIDLDVNISLVGEGLEGTRLLARTSGEQCLFTAGAGSSVEDLAITVDAATGAVAGTDQGLITLYTSVTGGNRFHNLRFSMNVGAAAPVNSAIALENDSAVWIENVEANNTTQRLGAEADWTCFVRAEQATANDIIVTNCVASGFDCGVFVGQARNVWITTSRLTSCAMRGVYQTAASAATIWVDTNYLSANDANCIAVSVRSRQGSASIISKNRILSFDAGEPAVHVRPSAGTGGYAKVIDNTIVWPYPAGAAVRIGTTADANPCNRSQVRGNTIVNAGAAGIGVEILELTSVTNFVQDNSIEATTLVINGGTTSEIAGNA